MGSIPTLANKIFILSFLYQKLYIYHSYECNLQCCTLVAGRQTWATLSRILVDVTLGLKPGVVARPNSGVASLHTFWCGMGVLKLGSCVDVCGCGMGVKVTHLHIIWHPHIKGLRKFPCASWLLHYLTEPLPWGLKLPGERRNIVFHQAYSIWQSPN